MRYFKQSFSVELIGVRHGHQWNGARGWQEIHYIPGDNEPLERGVKAILKPDFEDGKLTPDSYLKITLIKPNRRVIRYFGITLFKSISDHIEEM